MQSWIPVSLNYTLEAFPITQWWKHSCTLCWKYAERPRKLATSRLPQTFVTLPVNAAKAFHCSWCVACMELTVISLWGLKASDARTRMKEDYFEWNFPFETRGIRNPDSSFVLRSAQVCLKHTLMVGWLGVIQNPRALLGSVCVCSPRRGAFQVMAHPCVLSRGETKEAFSTVVTTEPRSSSMWAYMRCRILSSGIRQLVEIHKVIRTEKIEGRYVCQGRRNEAVAQVKLWTDKYAAIDFGLFVFF